MPGAIEAGTAERLENEALFRFGSQALENGFHKP
jgi:hypothetical protein